MEFHACRSSWERPRSSSWKSRAKKLWRSVRGGAGGVSSPGMGSGSGASSPARAKTARVDGSSPVGTSPSGSSSCMSKGCPSPGAMSGGSMGGASSGPLSSGTGAVDTSTAITSPATPSPSSGGPGLSPEMGRGPSSAPVSWGGSPDGTGGFFPGLSHQSGGLLGFLCGGNFPLWHNQILLVV